MKKSERTFAQRAIHSLQDSRSSLTEADVWKSSSLSTTWTNYDPPGNEIKNRSLGRFFCVSIDIIANALYYDNRTELSVDGCSECVVKYHVGFPGGT